MAPAEPGVQGIEVTTPTTQTIPMTPMTPMTPASAALRIEVVHCPRPGTADLVACTLPAGSTLADALHASGLLPRHALAVDGLLVGVWGRARPPSHALRDGDRVEIYRPLRVDPKEARRQRFQQQGGRRGRADIAGAVKTVA